MAKSQWTKCLGYCGKKFLSKDKIHVRICPKCKAKQNNINLSFRELGRFNIVEK